MDSGFLCTVSVAVVCVSFLSYSVTVFNHLTRTTTAMESLINDALQYSVQKLGYSSISSLLMFKDDFSGVLSVFWGELLGVFGIAP